jgi:hypothetical protein
MTDDELRALVKDAIARHLGSAGERGEDRSAGERGGRGEGRSAGERGERGDPAWRAHPSFGKFLVPPGDDEGGACIIEPTVHCNHCGFCQSYGH